MNIILLGQSGKKPFSVNSSQPGFYMSLLAIILIFSAGLLSVGFWVGGVAQVNKSIDPRIVQQWKETVEAQKRALAESKKNTQAHINALSQRLGELQAHVYRVDALGSRLTEMAKLDKGEFNFKQAPALGGPENSIELPAANSSDVIAALDALALQLQDREQQLSSLESMMLYGELQEEALPAGRPITKGWMSSFYGARNDPFTGKRHFHKGIDFAGKMGSDVVSVAAGVITWSGDRYGYGKMVEVDHGNGYATRYAHNSENVVKLGDKINKGQLIAKMGSSGRSTGPHVHFEVVKNGRVVDPQKYLAATR